LYGPITKIEQMAEQILERLLAGQEHMMANMKAGYLEITARLEAKVDSHHIHKCIMY
jgi:hypothetical protein